jgi:hypothetical protein
MLTTPPREIPLSVMTIGFSDPSIGGSVQRMQRILGNGERGLPYTTVILQIFLRA